MRSGLNKGVVLMRSVFNEEWSKKRGFNVILYSQIVKIACSC